MIMTQLRERTRDLHRRTESAVDLMNRLDSVDSYTRLLCRFYGLYAPLECCISTVATDRANNLNLQERRKSRFLLEDLGRLGLSSDEISQIPTCKDLPELKSLDEALGCLYVLEGSTLGGQIIRREVESRLGLTAETGCRFFTGYGDRTGIAWREFCEHLNSYAEEHPGAQEKIVSAAEETFQRFGEWVAC